MSCYILYFYNNKKRLYCGPNWSVICKTQNHDDSDAQTNWGPHNSIASFILRFNPLTGKPNIWHITHLCRSCCSTWICMHNSSTWNSTNVFKYWNNVLEMFGHCLIQWNGEIYFSLKRKIESFYIFFC